MPRGPRRRDLDQIQKDAAAADLYRQGETYSQIAAAMGMRSKSSAFEAVRRAIADLTTGHFAAAEALHLMLERIHDRRRKLQEVVDSPHYLAAPGGKIVTVYDPVSGCDVPVTDNGPTVRALVELRQLDDQEARLLDLNPATRSRVEVITEDVVDREIKRLAGEVARAQAPGPAVPPQRTAEPFG